MAVAQTDPGKLMHAKLPGECAVCGGTILPGMPIYFSKLRNFSKHKQCVEPGPEPGNDRAAAAGPAPADAPRAMSSARDASSRQEPWLFADGTVAPTPPHDDARRAPARDFGGGGGGAVERDAARRELGRVLDLLIDADRQQMEADRRRIEALERLRALVA